MHGQFCRAAGPRRFVPAEVPAQNYAPPVGGVRFAGGGEFCTDNFAGQLVLGASRLRRFWRETMLRQLGSEFCGELRGSGENR